MSALRRKYHIGLLALSDRDVDTHCEMRIQVINRQELWSDISYHIITTDKEAQQCRVEIQHPSKTCSVGTETSVHSSLEPLDRRNVEICAEIVPSVGLNGRETVSVKHSYRERLVEWHAVLCAKVHCGVQ